MSIDTELIVQILKRSPQGLTPFEILDHLINEPQYQGFSKPSIFSKLLPKLNELRDLQTLVHVSPRWLLMESTDDICEPDVLVEPSQSDCLDNPEKSKHIHITVDELQHSSLDTDKSIHLNLSDDFLVLPYDAPIEVLELSVRAYNSLVRSNIDTVAQLQDWSDFDLMNIRNFGQNSLDEVKTVLSKIKLRPFIQPELTISLEDLPDWSNISALQILTNDLLLAIRNTSSLSLRKVIRQLSELNPTVAHLVFEFESERISLTLEQRVELTRILNPFRILRNAPQAYLDWLSCLPNSTLIDILAKRQWTPENLSEVSPQLILSVTPPDFHCSLLQYLTSGAIPSKCLLSISVEINSFFDTHQVNGSLLKQRLGFQDGVIRTLEEIGQKIDLTRERIRQIMKKEENKIIYLKSSLGIGFLPKLFHISKMSLHSAGSIITLQNWTEEIEKLYPAGEIHLPSVILWFVEFIPEVHILKVADTQLFYMNPISEQIISDIQYQILEFWEAQKISDRSQLHQVLLPLLPENIENPEKAANTLISVFCQEPLPNVFSNKKWKMTDYAYYVLHESGKPLHFSEIGNRIKQLNSDWKATNIERSGQGLIERHPDIIRSGSGIYGLRDWGTMEYTHFREVLLDYLSKQPLPVDADVIHADLSSIYAVTATTVKMNLDFHPNLFQKFGCSYFYGLQGRHYELSDQNLIDLLVSKLEAVPLSLAELKQDFDLIDYSRDTIYLYLNVSPLFWAVGSSKDRKFGLSVNGKRQYQLGDATQVVVEIFEKIREPLHTKDFLRLIRIYYAYPPKESAFSRILAEDKGYMTIIEGIYIPRMWMDDENLSCILEDLDKNTFREVVKFTVGSKNPQPNADLLFDWLNFCYQNRFFYRGALVFEQLNLSELSDKKSAIARKIGQVCQRNGDISSLSFDQDKNSEEVDRNLRLDLEELRQQAKSGQRASTQGLATLTDGKYYVRYAGSNVEVHIEKWGGDTTPEMRVLQILCNGEPFDPTYHNPMVNDASLESRLEAIQKLYAATLNAYGQVDPYLQIALGARPTWGGVGYRNLKPVLGETT